MNDELHVGALELTVDCPLQPWTLEDDFIIEIAGRIKVVQDDDEEVNAGTVNAVLVRVAEARLADVNLLTVFDEHSEGLAEVYRALFDESGAFRVGLSILTEPSSILYIDSIDVRSDVLVCRVIESLAALFAQHETIVIRESVISWSVIGRLGLQWLVRPGLLLLDDTLKRAPYDDEEQA